jgi:hypothetical protein
MILSELLSAGTVLLCAILIKYAKLYDLMAGYNILPPERKAKVDAQRWKTSLATACLLWQRSW